MTAHQDIVLLYLFLCVVAVLTNAVSILLFKKYCERIAEKEGRIAECRSIFRGELGMNSFEIEQFGKVLSRHYLVFDDPDLTTLGDSLRFWSACGWLTAIALIAFIALIVL